MSDSDDTKEIPARQVPDQSLTPWRVHVEGLGQVCVLGGDGQLIAEIFPISGDRLDGTDGRERERALCIAKAPEMRRLLSLVVDTDRESFNVWTWVREVNALLERAK